MKTGLCPFSGFQRWCIGACAWCSARLIADVPLMRMHKRCIDGADWCNLKLTGVGTHPLHKPACPAHLSDSPVCSFAACVVQYKDQLQDGFDAKGPYDLVIDQTNHWDVPSKRRSTKKLGGEVRAIRTPNFTLIQRASPSPLPVVVPVAPPRPLLTVCSASQAL